MEILLFLAAVLVVLVVLDVAAVEVGADSRAGIQDTHAPQSPSA